MILNLETCFPSGYFSLLPVIARKEILKLWAFSGLFLQMKRVLFSWPAYQNAEKQVTLKTTNIIASRSPLFTKPTWSFMCFSLVKRPIYFPTAFLTILGGFFVGRGGWFCHLFLNIKINSPAEKLAEIAIDGYFWQSCCSLLKSDIVW